MAGMRLVSLIVCVTLHTSAAAVVSLTSHSLAVEDRGPTPIQRVVKLLREMHATLTKEAAADSEAYDKMVCWCESNEKEKTKAIADADAGITELLSNVESFAARDGELKVKIAQQKKDLAEKKESLATAVAIREKEHATFQAQETEMVQAVTMLKNAIAVLSKHNQGLLQMTPALQESLATTMRWAAMKHDELQENSQRPSVATAAPTAAAALLSVGSGNGAMADTVLRALRGGRRPSAIEIPVDLASKVVGDAASTGASFAQQQATQPEYFDQSPEHLKAYTPQSGQVFGILKQLKADFETNLSDAQKAEAEAQQEFEELRAASEKQIASMTQMLDDTEADFGANTKALSDAKEDLGVTRETRAADVKFLSNLRLECQDLDHQWKTRSKSRTEEIQAVAEALAILTDDGAQDLFRKKMGTGSASLLQVQTSRVAARRQAAAVLMRALRQVPELGDGAYKAWRPSEEKPHEQLAAMAMKVQLDAFAKVKKAIDDMVADLKAQQVQEAKHKEFCNTDLNDNEKDQYDTKQEIGDFEDRITELEASINKMTSDIEAAKEEIAATQVEVKKASEARKEENEVFKEEVADQHALQNILQKAIARLRLTYKKQEEASLVQEDPVSPVKFQAYKQHGGASGVIGLMKNIVSDSKAVENEAADGEQKAQAAYETFIADSTASIKALNDAIDSKTKAKATASIEKEETAAQLSSTEERLDDLARTAADLHQQCDFVLKNFNIRQKARQQEIEALQGAKALLSGMQDDDDSD